MVADDPDGVPLVAPGSDRGLPRCRSWAGAPTVGAVTAPPVRRRVRSPRRLLLVGTGILLLPAVLLAALLTVTYARAATSTVGEVDFTRPLAVPPLDEGRPDGAGGRVFDLELQQGTTDFGQGGAGETWGIDGAHLGPTLRASRGERLVVNVTNELDETTTLHWHGMHLPAAMDGGPHQVVAPGDTWSPTWTVTQPAATLWYHPHLHGETAAHVAKGLAGMLILDDEVSATLGLPDTYGVDDVPLIVQDRSFRSDGSFDAGVPLLASTGFLGDTLLVNGTVGPYLDVTTELVRLRLLNASNARVYGFGLADGRPLSVIGTDGGLLPAPVEATRVRLSPGERAEVVVAMAPGERVVLRSDGVDQGVGFPTDRLTGGDDAFDVLELRAADSLAPSAPLPDRLVASPVLEESAVASVRRFSLSGTAVNDLDMDLSRIDEVVTVGDTERWEVTNDDGQGHSFHVHDVQFRVLDDGSRPAWEVESRKDTVWVPPGETVRLLLRFADHTDPDVPYMFHCHLLRHEDSGMMGQFVVVRPGEEAGTLPTHADGGADAAGAVHAH